MSFRFNSRVPGRRLPLVLIAAICLGVGCWGDSASADEKDVDEKNACQKDPDKNQTDRDAFVGKKAGEERTFGSLRMKFCWCPPGKFKMGSPKGEAGRSEDGDQVDVTLTQGYWLGKYEVTQDDYQKVMGTNLSKTKGGRLPVERVTWKDATKFCERLTANERTAGLLPMAWEYRLPTEAQWEYACRAGSKSAYSFGDDADALGDFAWYDANSASKTHEVGQKKPNAWGLCNMHGNVAEWCLDAWEDAPKGGENPEVTEGSYQVVHGGDWVNRSEDCRSAYRTFCEPSCGISNLGFRVARCSVSQAR